MRELEEKQERLVRAAKESGLGGILLATHHNIAWLTGGRGNRVDASREIGTARLLVTADGRRFVLGNAIEMPRLLDEEVAGLDFHPIEYAWTEDQDPAFAVSAARKIAGDALGADWFLPGTVPFEPRIARARALLTEPEIDRYRALGADAGRVVGDVGRALVPGQTEREIARSIVHAIAGVRARAIVTLVGSDDRIRRYRHPVATDAKWREVVLVAVGAERDGLIVSLSRIVATPAGAAAIEAITVKTASVFGRLLDSTREGISGAQLFEAAAAGYRDAGFPDEERLHHQGGPAGYRSRDWIAHPGSQEVVQGRQAFAWNPTITGTKVEDTVLLRDGQLESITLTKGWPSIRIQAQGHAIDAPAVLRLA
jgi:Xaa-Pro dipeptidase